MNEITMAVTPVTHPRKEKPQNRVASRPYLPQLGGKHSLRQRPENAKSPGCGSGLGKYLDLGTRVKSRNHAEDRQALPIDTTQDVDSI